MKEFTKEKIVEGNKKIAIFTDVPTQILSNHITDELAFNLSYHKSFDALMKAINQLDDILFRLYSDTEYEGDGEVGNTLWEMWANELEDSSLYFTNNQLFIGCKIEEVYTDVLKSIDFLEKHKENVNDVLNFILDKCDILC